ncbi:MULTISPECIES: glutamate-cysteine ligase family protein [Streptomyces]|uniref:glutamate-cysteine ligase family protein n=1 Tax=Streptomyces TaxID=1883 RepID=UPI00163C798D|nr:MULTISPECIES: glutamate-cysteine ligase family protein [Streptomyces]MBC2876253.1 hypothetical protein [Streptomyces sp. TYQ1024]UBI35523.1 hypothetical protein K7I03_02930 [Streptomyces mobaraensis]UKW28116.1 glutamate-cysteine ligase family protein [Streptomyces sp. TYQ1024]
MKIGIESELPVVDRHGFAAGREAVRAVFRRLAGRDGFRSYADRPGGEPLGVRAALPGGTLDIGTDYGFCTVEAALPPEEDFVRAKAAWHACLDDVLLPALAAEGLSALGHGCQPRTETLGAPWLADKDHYRLWLERAERYPGHYAADAWPGFAAVQFNVDVPLAAAVTACDTLIKLTPLIFAWGSNDAVFGGTVRPWHSLRLRGYTELAASNPFFAHRLLLPHHLYRDLSDYVREAWARPVFQVEREGAVHSPVDAGLTTAEFAAAGRADFVDRQGVKRTLRCTPADLAAGLVYYWPAVRIRLRLDETLDVPDLVAAVAAGRAEEVLADGGRGCFVEIRHLPTMGRAETFAWLAMLLGWLGDLDGCRALTAEWTLDDVRSATEDVLANGWSARLRGRPLPEWGAAAFDLAEASLRRDPVAPADELAPLARRLADRTSPSADTVACLERHGVEALVDRLRL